MALATLAVEHKLWPRAYQVRDEIGLVQQLEAHFGFWGVENALALPPLNKTRLTFRTTIFRTVCATVSEHGTQDVVINHFQRTELQYDGFLAGLRLEVPPDVGGSGEGQQLQSAQ